MYIELFILALVINPIFSLNTIFMVYDIYKFGYKNLEEQKRKSIKEVILMSVIIYIILTFGLLLIIKSFEVYMMVLLCAFGIFYEILSGEISFNNFIDTKVRKITNNIFKFVVIVALIVYMISLFSEIIKLRSVEVTIPTNIENFSKENELILFNLDDLTYSISETDNKDYYYYNNKDYFFSFEMSEKYTINVINKSKINSFELSCNDPKIENCILYDKYGISSKYDGANIRQVCFLVNENSFYELRASIVKNEKNNTFYVKDYFLINLKNGSIEKVDK